MIKSGLVVFRDRRIGIVGFPDITARDLCGPSTLSTSASFIVIEVGGGLGPVRGLLEVICWKPGHVEPPL